MHGVPSFMVYTHVSSSATSSTLQAQTDTRHDAQTDTRHDAAHNAARSTQHTPHTTHHMQTVESTQQMQDARCKMLKQSDAAGFSPAHSAGFVHGVSMHSPKC